MTMSMERYAMLEERYHQGAVDVKAVRERLLVGGPFEEIEKHDEKVKEIHALLDEAC